MMKKSVFLSAVRAGNAPELVEPVLGKGVAPTRGVVACAKPDGLIQVTCADQSSIDCEILEGMANLTPGTRVLVLPPARQTEFGVILGKIARHGKTLPAPEVVIEATEVLTLKCGEASIDLRADGKVMVRGEDVLLRAKGTQRIRAGTVSIN